MSDPLTPEGLPEQPPLHQPGGDAEQAGEIVELVIGEYNTRLVAARREPGRYAPEVVAGWRTARDRAVNDLERLETAGEDETVQIALAYAARLKELKAT
ncbi:hypothetical protein OHU11_41695 (plasmid) [Streptomyces sp. NBC_00257]|uniref:hypothetical protein n=1 Tax=Streptomyces TaxID=1883 RepID=UPI00225BA5A8|nr:MULTISPECIES: hypothetical protein [unclassified Streptomyces]MCX5434695.1 hypothetical protein [Streptomyces sp. NBC_00062]WTD01030.1 hypothetical protein OH736_45815 [Streptomyces sp. NBC_01650]